MKKAVLILLGVILLFGLVGGIYAEETTTGEEQPACPEDVFTCPDGTDVSRVPPDCKFAPCPEELLCEDYVCPDGTTAECFVDEEGICNCETCPAEEEPVEVVCKDYTCDDGTVAECYLDDGICTCEICEAEEDVVCKDSDGGKNYYIKGAVTASNSHLTYEDKCAYGQAGNPDTMDDPNLLFEAHCFEKEFGYGYDFYYCPNGCSDGVCIGEERECPIGCVCTENTIACGSGDITATNVTATEECPAGCECTEEGIACAGPVTKPTEKACYMGCRLSDRCVIQGTRANINKVGSYCSIEGKWNNQKGTEDSCQNNYECKTNFCSNNACVDISGELKETKGILEKIVNFLRKLFGFE